MGASIQTKKELRATALDFILQNRAAALATVDTAGLPDVATVYCLAEADMSIYFVTRIESRKYANICTEPVVAMTFMNEKLMVSLQLRGRAVRVEALAEEQRILYELTLARHQDENWPSPPLKMLEHGLTGELAIMRVSPTEMTLATFETQPSGKYNPFFKHVIEPKNTK